MGSILSANMPNGVMPQNMTGMDAAKNKNAAGIQKAAKNFEAMYMQEMLGHMWDGVKTDGAFGGGHGEEIFRSMLIGQYGKMISDSGQTKIADTLTTQILRMQEQQQNPRGLAVPKTIPEAGDTQ